MRKANCRHLYLKMKFQISEAKGSRKIQDFTKIRVKSNPMKSNTKLNEMCSKKTFLFCFTFKRKKGQTHRCVLKSTQNYPKYAKNKNKVIYSDTTVRTKCIFRLKIRNCKETGVRNTQVYLVRHSALMVIKNFKQTQQMKK